MAYLLEIIMVVEVVEEEAILAHPPLMEPITFKLPKEREASMEYRMKIQRRQKQAE